MFYTKRKTLIINELNKENRNINCINYIKMRKNFGLILALLFCGLTFFTKAQIVVPGGIVTDSAQFSAAFGDQFEVRHNAMFNRYELLLTDDILLDTTLTLVSGHYTILSQDTTRHIYPNQNLLNLIEITEGATLWCNYTNQAMDSTFLIFSGNYNDSVYCSLSIITTTSLNLLISPFSIIENYTGAGSAIISFGNTSIDDAILRNNYSFANGGALSILDGTTVLRRTQIQNNSALNGGGIYLGAEGELSISSINFSDNSATLKGAALYVDTIGFKKFTMQNIVNFHNNDIYLSPNVTINANYNLWVNDGFTLNIDSTFACQTIFHLTDFYGNDFSQEVGKIHFTNNPIGLELLVSPDLQTAMLYKAATEIYQDACDTFHWELADETYSQSGDYLQFIEDSTGLYCDSVVRLRLTMRETIDTIERSFCHYEFPIVSENDTIEEAGIYSYTYTSSWGCDSTITLIINSIPTIHDTLPEIFICKDEFPVMIADSAVTTYGEHTINTACGGTSFVRITETPIVHINIDTTICANQLPFFFADSAITEAGEYTFEFTESCDTTFVFRIAIATVPIVNIEGDSTLCTGDTTQLTINEEFASYTWNTGETTRTINAWGNQTYIVTITDSVGCVNSDSILVQTQEYPIAQIMGDPIACEENFVLLSADSTYHNHWSNGDTSNSVFITQPGELILYASTDYGCMTTDTTEVIINHVQISEGQDICVGETVQLSATEGFPIYEWSTGGNTHQISVSPTTTTTYTLSVTRKPGCVVVLNTIVRVHEHPEAMIFGDSIICENNVNMLTAAPADSYVWSTGDTTKSIMANGVGDYSVILNTRYGCSVTAHHSITQELPAPIPQITGNNIICNGEESIFTASGADNFEWNTGAHSESISVNTAGTYSVTCVHPNGCSATGYRTLINASPQIIITGDTSICIGQTSIVEATGGYSYHWSTGENSPLLVTTPTQTTTRILEATSESGCQSSRIVTIAVNPLPNPSILGESVFCQGDSSTLYASGGVDYLWSNGASGSEISIKNTGIYVVTVTNAFGCTNTASHSITANAQPHITITGDTIFCQGSNSQLTAIGGTSFLWNTGVSTQSTIVSHSGLYTVTATNNNGCSSTKSVHITSIPAPIGNIIGETRICEGERTLLTATGGTSYIWNEGSTEPTLSVTQAGTYTVTISNEEGCTSIVSKNVTTLPRPNATIAGNTELCAGNSTTLIATGGISYLWNDSTTTSFKNITETGTYSVIVTDNNGCSAVASTTVIVNEAPDITITGDAHICIGESTLLTATIYGSGHFLWSNGEQSSFINVSPNHTTNYTVVATNTNGCVSTESFTINVHPYPNPAIIGESSFCQGERTTLTAVGGNSYLWSNYEQTPSISVSTPGVYVVTVSSEYGCSSTSSHTVVSHPLPVPQITGESTFCDGSFATLNASGGISYLWSSGEATPNISAYQAGTYMVTITNEHGCTSTAQTQVSSNTPPSVVINGATEICEGDYTVFNVASNANCSYVWNTESVGNSIVASTAGTYTVTATSPNGCTATTSHTMRVNPLPTPSINGNLTPCLGKSTTLTVTGGATYVWSTGSTADNITIQPTAPITYSVTATSSAGCTATNSVAITTYPVPSPSIQGNTILCHEGTSTLTAVGGITFNWSTGATSNNITINEAGTYTVTITNSFGCSATTSAVATVEPQIIANIVGNDIICAGEQITLYATGGENYLWNTGLNTASLTHTPTTNTTYTCTITSINGCEAVASKEVTVTPLPTPEISGSNFLCEGSSIQLTATGGSAFVWSNGITSNQNTITEPGIYTVTVTQNNCSASTQTYITQHPSPHTTISGNTQFCAGDSTSITATGGDSYLWNTGATTNSIVAHQSGNYSVTISDEHGCTATQSLTVTVLELPQITINGNTQLCMNDASLLTAHGANYYIWNNGVESATLSVLPTENTTYSVTGTHANGCTASTSISLIVYPIFNIELSDEICQGGNYNENGFILGYQDEYGTFTHTRNLQTSHGCDSIVTLTLTVHPKPILPAAISGPSMINTAGSYSYSVLNAEYTNSYEWSLNNPNWTLNAGSNNFATINITTNSSAILSVIGINECGISAPLTLNIESTISIDEIDAMDGINIYPNPTTNFVNIRNENYQKPLSLIEIYDLNGKLVDRIFDISETTQINFYSYSKGTYIIKLFNQENVIGTAKIIKQ